MKTPSYFLVFLLLLIVCISSCSKQKNKSSEIPEKQSSEIPISKTPNLDDPSLNKKNDSENIINYASDQGEVDVTIKGNQAFVMVMRKNQPVLEFVGNHVPSASGSKYEGIHLSYWAKGEECMIIDESSTLLKGLKETKSFGGMFIYMADANAFFPCLQSTRLPISMNDTYLELERKYLSLVDGGTKIYANVQGYIKESKSIEGNKSEPTLFISRINELSKSKSCD